MNFAVSYLVSPGRRSSPLVSQLRFWMLVFGLPPVIMGVALLGALYQWLILSAEQGAERTGRQAGDTLDRVFFERSSDVELFSSLPVARTLDKGKLQSVVDLFISTYAPYYVRAVVVDRTGNVLASGGRALSGQAVGTGQVINPSAARATWFQDAVADHLHVIVRYWSGDFFDSAAGSIHDDTIVFSKAIKDDAGAVVGVWATSLAVESLRHVFDKKDGAAEGFPYPIVLKTPSGKKLLTIGEFDQSIPITVIRSTGFSRWPGGQWTLETQIPAQFSYRQRMLLSFGSLGILTMILGAVAIALWVFRSRLIRPLEALESQVRSITLKARIPDREQGALLRQPVESDRPSHEWLLHRDDELGDIARLLAAHTEEVRKHVNQLVMLNESSRDIQEQVLSLPALLSRIVSTAKSLTHARYAALGVFDESGTELVQFMTEGIDEETKKAIGALPTGRGLLGALHKQAVLRLKDLTQHQTSVGFPPHHPAMRSFLGVALRAHGKLYGRLYLTDKLLPTTTGHAGRAAESAVGEFAEFDEQLIRVLAIQAGAAIETAGMIEEIRTTQSRDRALLDSVEEGIYGINLAGRCLFINRAGSKMLGYEQDALLGLDIHALIHHSRDGGGPCLETACPMRSVLKNQSVFRLESEIFRRKDGTSFPVMGTAIPLQEESGTTGAVVSFSDLTERRSLELQVRQGQKLEALGQLAGGVAHDFNNIMTVIRGQSELALWRAVLPASARAGIEEIKRAADRATALTGQLLTFSRKKPLERKVVDLHQVIRGVRSLIHQMLGEQIVLSIELADGPRSVKLDPGGFEQILINLAVNARDAMPGGGRLEIRCASLDSATMAERFPAFRSFGASVMITVSDTGVGMDKATQARIFEPFFTTKEVGRGTGLGLATVARLVQDNSGAVQVASEPGVGTTFTLLFPSAASAVESCDTPVVDVPIRGGDETILLVENDRTVQSLVATMLQNVGYHVLTANDGREGKHVANQYEGAIHALVSDVTMPHMSGPALAKSLRRRRPDLKILFITGHADAELERYGPSLEQVDLLQKPFSQTAFLEAVRRVLDQPGGPLFLPHAVREPACVLIVDDDEQVNTLLQEMLSNEGYRVLAALSGAKGINLLRQEPVDLLLTDMLMSDMDGLKAVKESRQFLPSLKVIAMSGGGIGLAPEFYLDAARQLGVSSVLAKPFSCEALIKTVRQTLGAPPSDP